jgi:hypothetical protein
MILKDPQSTFVKSSNYISNMKAVLNFFMMLNLKGKFKDIFLFLKQQCKCLHSNLVTTKVHTNVYAMVKKTTKMGGYMSFMIKISSH